MAPSMSWGEKICKSLQENAIASGRKSRISWRAVEARMAGSTSARSRRRRESPGLARLRRERR